MDLRRGIEEVERQRENVPEEQEGLRISFLDQSESLFDEMIRLQIGRPGGAEPALDYSERDRARALLDHLEPLNHRQRAMITERSVEPLTSREIQKALPAGVAIIEYRVLDDRLLVWIIRRCGIELKDQAVSALALEALVANLRAGLTDEDPELSFTSGSAALYDLLLRPILPHLHPGDRLLFVPDESLHRVPFSALFNRDTEHYLLQDRVVAVAPSATFYVRALERERILAAGPRKMPTVLAVGNPRFDRSVAQRLSDLPQAEREAAAVVGGFPGSALLAGEAATETAFLSAAGRYELIHFGGHAVVNEDYPFLSYLLMAPEGEPEPGLLYAHELYGRRFDRTQLAVLAGCETGGGQIRGEGVLSIARAFLAAGVPTVVASLWSVDDRASGHLFTTFYERLRRGDDPAAALRRAQLDLLEHGGSGTHSAARNWAAFQVSGGLLPSK